MKKLIYVGMYDILREGKKSRSYSLAEAKKMDYIVSVLVELGYDVEIMSGAYINIPQCGFVKGYKERLGERVVLVLPTSWSAKNKISRVLRRLTSLFSIFHYLVKNTKHGDRVMIYHNYYYAIPVLLAQRIKKFDLILEVEEQYAMVWKLTPWQKKKEDMLLKKGSDGSLVVSEVLAKKLGIRNPIVSYGSYTVYQGNIQAKGKQDIITLIYTGSIDKTKDSAYRALEVMKYLPEKYQLFISGYVVNGEEEYFQEKLAEVNSATGNARCRYLGLLDDEQYRDLLLNADIALNLQQDGEFGTYLFPSKILTYLAYNLDVVSTKGESIINSSLRKYLHIADGYNYVEISALIQSIDFKRSCDYRAILENLSTQFKEKLDARLRS